MIKADHFVVGSLALLALAGTVAIVVVGRADPSDDETIGHLVDLIGIVLTGLLLYVGVRRV